MASGTILRIKWSKMLQQKEGLLLNPLPSIPRAMLCPLSTIQNYFCMAPTSSPTTPFFCLSATSGCCPRTATNFCTSLKHLISHIGLHPEDYSPHSFRCSHCIIPALKTHWLILWFLKACDQPYNLHALVKWNVAIKSSFLFVLILKLNFN